MYKIAALIARLSLRMGFFFGTQRFIWRFAPALIGLRESISKYYQYKIPPVLNINAGGNPFRLTGSPWNSMASGIYWGGILGFEIMETKLINALSPNYKTALDIGANVGWFTLVMLAKNPNLKVCAFEPQPEVRDILKKNLALNHFSAVVEDLAVSEVDGTASFHVTDEDCTSSLLEMDGETQTLTIQTTSIDSYVKRNGLVVDFIKMDVEGNELPALLGARQTLKDQSPDMLFEIMPGQTDVTALRQILAEAGYFTAWTIGGDRWVEDADFKMCAGRMVINYFVSKKRQPPV